MALLMANSYTILKIRDGEIINRSAVSKLFAELKAKKNADYTLEAKKISNRSLPQNRYYWGVCIPLIQKGILDMGTELTKEECHDFLKGRFNYAEVINKDSGEYITIPKSTADLSKEEFCTYIEKIQQFASEFLNIVIPNPNEQLSLTYQD